jgi:AraC-like DNA-binding protein
MQGQLSRLFVESAQFDPAERFARWQAGVDGTFDVLAGLEPTPQRDISSFSFSSTWWQAGTLILGDSTFSAHQSIRTVRHTRRDQVDHYRLLLRQAGELRSEANGVRQILPSGEMILLDMSQPDHLMHGQGTNIDLIVPREMLDEALPRPFDLHGFSPRGAMAELLRSHLQALVAAAPRLDRAVLPNLNQSTVAMIAACALPSRDTLERARPVVESTVLRQICRYIELHLDQPDLSVEQLAGMFRVSRATLYRLFEPLGGVRHHIRERRLARAHAILARASARVSIRSLAESSGFGSATHFSRAFREQYGYNPRNVPHGAFPGPRTTRHNDSTPHHDSLSSWFRSLRD